MRGAETYVLNFCQKMDKSGGQKSVIEFATYFCQAISESVLWDSTELIKVAALVDFNVEAVDFLMKSNNLHIFMENEEFVRTA